MIDKLHKRLLDSLTTGVIVLDVELRLAYINLAAESLLAISSRQFAGAFIGDLFLDSEQDVNDIRNASEAGQSFTRRRAELHLLHGKSLTVDYSITHLPDMGAASLVMEIQPLSHAERIDRDEASISTHEATRELVRGLAHEIKNPLGGIRGAAQLLARELPDVELHDYTNVIIEEADRLHTLVDRMVGLRELPEMRPLNIHEVVERVRSLIEAEIGDRDILIERNYDPSIPELQGDFEQLIQAVLNIVRNAMQALTESQPDPQGGVITLKTRVLRNLTIGQRFHRLVLRLDIIDNGPGIPEDLISNIFFPMISGRAEGTGLGLSIAHSIINRHHGSIECDSRPGCTRFAIFLPINHQAGKA